MIVEFYTCKFSQSLNIDDSERNLYCRKVLLMLDGYIDISRYLFLKKHNWHAVFLFNFSMGFYVWVI